MPDRAYTDPELDAAVAAISEPGRLREAQDVVTRTAPALQRVLGLALQDGGWFDQGHDQAVREAAAVEDSDERASRVRTMLVEETRLGMLVGVAVGFELARELERPAGATAAEPAHEAETAPEAKPAPEAEPGTESTEQED